MLPPRPRRACALKRPNYAETPLNDIFIEGPTMRRAETIIEYDWPDVMVVDTGPDRGRILVAKRDIEALTHIPMGGLRISKEELKSLSSKHKHKWIAYICGMP